MGSYSDGNGCTEAAPGRKNTSKRYPLLHRAWIVILRKAALGSLGIIMIAFKARGDCYRRRHLRRRIYDCVAFVQVCVRLFVGMVIETCIPEVSWPVLVVTSG